MEMDTLTPEQRQRIDANLQQAKLRRLKRLEQWHNAEQTSLQRSVSQVDGTLRVKVLYVSPPKTDRHVSIKENLQLNNLISASDVQSNTAASSKASVPEELLSPMPCTRISFDTSPVISLDAAKQAERFGTEPNLKKPVSAGEQHPTESTEDEPNLSHPPWSPRDAQPVSADGAEESKQNEESKQENGGNSDLSIVSEDSLVLEAMDELERSGMASSASCTKTHVTAESNFESRNEADEKEASRSQNSDDERLLAALDELERSGVFGTSLDLSAASTRQATETASPTLDTPVNSKILSVVQQEATTHESFLTDLQESPAASEEFNEPKQMFKAADDLNDAQRQAAYHDPDTPLLILAGAGSGKTKTLITRVRHLVERGVQADKLLVLTFSTAATSELQQRVRKALPKARGAAAVCVSTFHSFALSVCREFGSLVGLPPDFLVFTGGRTRKVVSQGLLELRSRQGGGDAARVTLDKASVKRLCQAVVQAKAHEQGADALDGEVKAVLEYYEEAMRQCGSLDFCALISRASQILREHPSARAQMQERYSHLLVDEFQDTSRSQLELVRAMVQHGRITVVGDDDQTIFGFNGSNHQNFALFRQHFPSASEVRLEHNYRSSAVIVHASRALIEHNQFRAGKAALPTTQGGELISVVECRSEHTEVAFVVGDVKQRMQRGTPLREMAILCRTKKTGQQFQAELRRQRIPFNIHGVSFWRRKVIKAVVAALRVIRNSGDDQACRRMLKTFLAQDKGACDAVVPHVEKVAAARRMSLWDAARECLLAKVSGAMSKKHMALGRRMVSTMDGLITLARSSPRLSDFVQSVMAAMPQSHMLERKQFDDDGAGFLNEGDDQRTLREVLSDFILKFEASSSLQAPAASQGSDDPNARRRSECERQIESFLDRQLVEEEESHRQMKEDNSNAVTLSTIHRSKGLEWSQVYLVRFNAGELPLTNNVGVELRGLPLEEERRLCYVAVTRARDHLTISHVKTLCKQVDASQPWLLAVAD